MDVRGESIDEVIGEASHKREGKRDERVDAIRRYGHGKISSFQALVAMLSPLLGAQKRLSLQNELSDARNETEMNAAREENIPKAKHGFERR